MQNSNVEVNFRNAGHRNQPSWIRNRQLFHLETIQCCCWMRAVATSRSTARDIPECGLLPRQEAQLEIFLNVGCYHVMKHSSRCWMWAVARPWSRAPYDERGMLPRHEARLEMLNVGYYHVMKHGSRCLMWAIAKSWSTARDIVECELLPRHEAQVELLDVDCCHVMKQSSRCCWMWAVATLQSTARDDTFCRS
jgi:hypothetical protein